MAARPSPGAEAKIAVGTRVEIAKLGQGVVGFEGQTSFAAGRWAGVVLDEPNGKNDGTVQGKRYFEAQPLHGVFVRPSQIKVLRQPAALAPHASAVSSPTKSAAMSRASSTSSRPSSTIGRPSSTGGRPSSISGRPSMGGAARPSTGTPTAAAAARRFSTTPSTPSSATPFRAGSVAGRPLARTSAAGAAPSTPAAGRSRLSMSAATPASATRPGGTHMRTPGGVSTPRPSLSSRVPPSSASANIAARIAAAGKPSSASAAARPSPSSALASAKGRSSSRAGVKDPLLSPAASSASIDATSSLLDEELDIPDGGSDDGAERLVSGPRSESRQRRTSSPTKSPPRIKPDPMSLQAPARNEHMVPIRELEELRVKLRIAEAKRAEDRDKMREMDRVKQEAEQFLSVKPKMQERMTDQQTEIRDLQRLLKDATAEREDFESKLLDMTEQLEMATLDKEVAEEKNEAAQLELEGLKEKAADMEVELSVLREENAAYELGEISETDRSSMAYIQLEKQNERLKDALLRLRDITNETDQEQRRKINELEKELMSLQDLQTQYETVKDRLELADLQVEDLKLQLDDALGAEDMLEQLTERNLFLGEASFVAKLEEMQIALEDLEAIKELNDELEENHVETEKQLQEEIDFKDMQLRELKRRTETLEENVADYENTFAQFRELVTNLQNDLEQLREQQQTQSSESKELTSQSQAMLNLNLKLQSSALKSQAKMIELELGKMEASQAMENLKMTKPYLPPAFFEADADSVNALLFFQRLAIKSDLIKQVVEQNHDIAESLNTIVPENMIAICQMRNRLAHFSALNRRIVAVLQACSVEMFLKIGRVYHDLTSVERKVDGFIEMLRREELREAECGREFGKFIAQFDHLFDTQFDEADTDLGERELGCAATFDLDLDTLAAAIGFAKQSIAVLSKDPEVEWDLAGKNLDDDVFDPMQQILHNVKSCKVPSKKLLRRLTNLVRNSEAVRGDSISTLPTLAELCAKLVVFATRLAESVAMYTTEVRTAKMPFEMSNMLQFIEDATEEALGRTDVNHWAGPLASTAHLAQSLATVLQTAEEKEYVIQIGGQGPWLARVQQMKQNAAVNVDAERKVSKLNEDVKDLVREVKTRDQALQESAVKIELMEKRLETIKKQAEAITELESDLTKAKKQAKEYDDHSKGLQEEIEALREDYDKLQKAGPMQAGGASSGAATIDGEVGPAAGGSLETSYLIEQIESLRGAVRFLRAENTFLKSQDLLVTLQRLPVIDQLSGKGPLPSRTMGTTDETALADAADSADDAAALGKESKVLYREILRLTSTPRVVDLSHIRAGQAWQRAEWRPEHQYRVQKEQAKVMRDRVRRLTERLGERKWVTSTTTGGGRTSVSSRNGPGGLRTIASIA